MKKKLYRSKVKIGVDQSGKDIFKWFSGHTRAEFERNKQAVIEEYITGEARKKDRLTGEYTLEWYETKKKPYCSVSSRMSYANLLNKYILPSIGEKNLRAVTQRDIQTMLDAHGTMANSMLVKLRCVTHMIFAAAIADGYIERNPADCVRIPTEAKERKKKQVLTKEQRQLIIDKLPTLPEQHRLLVGILYYTGMRVGEACGLYWSDIDLDRNVIHIERDLDMQARAIGDVKTSAAVRDVPIVPELRDILMPCRSVGIVLRSADGKEPMYKGALYAAWQMAMRECGLSRSDGRPLFYPHVMRHNFISMCWERGVDVLAVGRIVGHASAQVTMDIYSHFTKEHFETVASAISGVFSGDSCTKVAQAKSKR